MTNLRALVLEELNDSPHPDIRLVAEAVGKAVEEEHLRDALIEALPDYVRTISNGVRNALLNVRIAEIARTGRPSRRAATDDRWQKALNTRIAVGDGVTKFFRDCTADDFFAAAAIRRKNAAGEIVWAEKHEAMGKKLRQHRASTPVDLGERLTWEAYSE